MSARSRSASARKASPTGTRSRARKASRNLPFANIARAWVRYVSVGAGTGNGAGAGGNCAGAPMVACTGNQSARPFGVTSTNAIVATSTIAAAVAHHKASVPRRPASRVAFLGLAEGPASNRRSGTGRALPHFEAIDAAEHAERDVVRGTLVERIAQQLTRAHHFAPVEGIEALVHERFGNALAFGLRAARAIDVGTRPIVGPIEKQHAGPEIDGLFEFAGEVVIETGHEQMLDPRFLCRFRVRLGAVRASRPCKCRGL